MGLVALREVRLALIGLCCILATGCPSPSGASLLIVEPADGAELNLASDTNPSIDGVQVQVTVQAVGVAVGSEVDILVDDGTIAATTTTPDDGNLVFEDVTVPAGTHTLRAITRVGDTRSEAITVTVSSDCFAVSFVTPMSAAGRVTLGPADDTDGEACGSAFETTVVVSTGAPDGSEARVFVNGTPRLTATVAEGVARFEGVGFDLGADLAQALTVTVTDSAGVACGAEFPVPIFIDCAGVRCSITSPDTTTGFLNQSNDVSDAPGFQGDFEVTTDEEGGGQPVRLIIDGNETDALSSMPDGTIATFGNVPLGEGVHRVVAECRDGSGNVSRSGAVEWTVDTIACDVGIGSPAAGTLFIDSDDLDTSTPGIDIDSSGTAGADCSGLRVDLCSAIEAMPFGTAETDWTRRVELGSSPTQTLCAQSQDPAGNINSTMIDLRVRTSAPQLEIVIPAADTGFNLTGAGGRTADLTTGNSTCEALFDVYCTDVGEDVVLERSDTTIELARTPCVAEAGLPAPYAGRATFPSVSLPPVEDGSAFPVVAYQDVDRLVGRSTPISLRSDCVAPPLSVARPRCGNTLRLSVDDEDLATPGLQHRTHINNPTDPAEDVVLVIRPVGGGSPTYTATNTMTATTSIFDGANYGSGGLLEIVATVTDNAGNVADTAGCTVTVEDLPSLVVVEPTDGSALGPSDDCDTSAAGFQVRVRATTNAAAGSSGEVRVGTMTPVTATVSGGAFEVCTDAPDGMVAIQISVTDARGTSTATTNVTIDTMPPTTAITPLTVSTVDRRGGVVRLGWTAVADADGGALSSYELRCSATDITSEAQWTAATVVPVMATPGTAGTMQSEDVDAFRVGETVFCVLRGADPVGALTPLPAGATAVTIAFLEQAVAPATGPAFGDRIAPIGDVNGDTLDDLVVGGDGVAFLYFGSATLGATPGVRITGPAGAFFGSRVAGLGDINGDTIPDFAVGAFGENSAKGAIYVFFGRSSGGAAWPATIDVSTGCGTTGTPNPGGCMVFRGDDGAAGGPDEFAGLGFGLSSAGDFDGDGLMDLALGAGPANAFIGRAYVILGRSSLAAGQTVLVPGPAGSQPDGFVMDGTTEYRQLGTSVASVGGDMTGDGRDELLVGAPGSGTAAVTGKGLAVLGRAYSGSGLVAIPSSAYVVLGTGPAGRFGGMVAALGDVNNDGRLDAAVQDTASAGQLTVFLGTAGGFVSPASFTITNDLPGAASDDFGGSIGTGVHPWLMRIGDVDADGVVDILVGATQTGTAAGSVDLFYRDSSTSMMVRSAAHSTFGPVTAAARAAYAGDLNGDGFGDIVVGDPGFNAGAGRILIQY